MWLEAYKSSSHDVYFATKAREIEDADKSSPAYQGNFSNNISTPEILETGKTYYWRVDAIVNDRLVKGELWSFTVENKQ